MMVTYLPTRKVSRKPVGGVVDHAGIVASGVVVAESAADFVQVSTEASEGNVAAQGEGREASVGAVTVTEGAVIEGAMENGVAVVAAEAVDAEDFPKVGRNPLFKHRRAFPYVDALLPTKKRAQPHLDDSWSIHKIGRAHV